MPDSIAVTARVVSMTNTSATAKAGVMIRASLDPDAAYVINYAAAANGTHLEYRSAAGASAALSATGLAGVAPPMYVRLTRWGGTIAGAYSTDGAT